jgi:hypothetical protein
MKNWLIKKKLTIAVVVGAAIVALLSVSPAFATDAMKPGHQDNGDKNHEHYGAPGQVKQLP